MDKCGICTETFKKRVSIDCGHEFCFVCISKWVKLNNLCPLCRAIATKYVENGTRIGSISQPKKSYGLVIDDYVHGDRPQRIPWSQQLNLPGFVIDELPLDEVLSFSEPDDQEVSEAILEEKDTAPISSRLRQRRKREVK